MASANVTNTNVVFSETTGAPYWNDYNEFDNYLGMVFRPGYAVQARELTQMQTMSQVQVERLGRHIFKNGSIVIGGQISYDKTASINLQTQYIGTDVDVSDFVGNQIIFASGNNDVRAEVIAGQNATDTEPPTLMIKYLSGQEFGPSSVIKVSDAETYANVATSGHRANGITSSLTDGIFFINGYFVRTGRQTIAVSKYDVSPNVKIGLEFTEAIVDENTDANLRDPALGSSNYQAPGATRYKMDVSLATRTLTSVDDEAFIELTRLSGGLQQKVVLTPIYSELEETFARRTFDESGNYTVRPFRLEQKQDSANTSNLVSKLDPGKAYVFGYEYETIAPQELTYPRPRDTETTSNYDISLAYGNYLVMKNMQGFIDISTMPMANLHCVPWTHANNENASTFLSTQIGTTRVRNVVYYSTSNVANGQMMKVGTYIFDTRLTSLTGNATAGTANTITLNLPTISSNDDAYNLATLRITDGTSEGDVKTIVDYVGSTKVATVDSDFSTTPDANSVFSIDFSTREIESLMVGGAGSTITANLDVDILSKDNLLATGNTAIKEPAFKSLVFPMPKTFVKDGLTVNNYQYRKVFSSVTFTAGVGSITAGTGESLVGSGTLTESQILTNYLVVVDNPDATGYVAGQIAPLSGISVTGSTATITATDLNNFTADVYASIEIDSGTVTNPKAKTIVSANLTHITTATSNGTFVNSTGSNTTVYLTEGQVIITEPNRTPTVKDSLYISDLHPEGNVAIYDLNGASITYGAALSGYTDVTSKYTIDNGQRDTHYDHGGIILKSGVIAPKGPLVVCIDYYQHDTGTGDGLGYFSVDSYPDSDTVAGYQNIPYYTGDDGIKYRLNDVIDFRPRRADASNSSPNYTFSGIRIPTPNEEYTVTFDYYLPRKDLIVLTRDRQFKLIQGISAQYPYPPNDPDDAMVLYRLSHPPFVLYPANTYVEFVENKRYTMRDIGKIDTRLRNVEYYQQLTLLEKAAADLLITDVNGLERTKYGIIVDQFVGHQIGDVTNPDYNCSMDFSRGELRPFFKLYGHDMDFLSGDSNYKENGTLITLDYTEATFIEQNTASKAENVQPYLIARYIGSVDLVPDNDIWVDTSWRPDVLVNLDGVNDAWEQLAEQVNGSVFGTEWNAWETHWTGRTRRTTRQGTRTTTTTTTTGTQIRTGTTTELNWDTVTQELGDRVVDISIIPFIRSREIDFFAYNLRPNRELYPFFDNESVLGYIKKPNIIKLSSNTIFNDGIGYNEDIISGANTARVLLSRPANNDNVHLHVTDVVGTVTVGDTWTGNLSANSAVVAEYEHYSGNALGGTTSTINLAAHASTTDDWYNGNTIYIVAGVGVGSNTSISDYNGATQVATVSPALGVTPTTNTQYSIGGWTTTESGIAVGNFVIPADSTLRFRTGERVFRVVDRSDNDLDNVTTRGEGRYNAQGLLQTKEGVSISTTVPRIEINEITETRTVRRSVSTTRTTDTPDPLAQTFYVNEIEYPNGLFLSSVDLFFRTKDTILPVWVEIRPTVNGYPHSSLSIPYSKKVMYPDQVNLSELPNAANSATTTTFTFDNPVYLEPGKEYALVVQTNSLDYETWVSELGKKRVGSDRIISEQPYLGSLFKSQNASTWTAFQLEDLMFVLNRCQFTTSSSTVYFNNKLPTNNNAMDWMNIQTNALLLANTDVTYAFKTTNHSDLSVDSSFTNVITNQNYKHTQRKIVHNLSKGSVNLKATMVTTNPHVSPVLDTTRFNVISVENIINNANLSNSNIILTNDGDGYAAGDAANISISITGGGFVTAANAYVGEITTNAISSIVVDTGGTYYSNTANVTISGGSGANATAVIESELNPTGGPALSKYLTRKVVLAEGFDAGDIQVFLTAYKPVGTDIYVYVKVKNYNDPTPFDEHDFIKLEQITPSNRYSTSSLVEDVTGEDAIEYEWRPSSTENKLEYVRDGVLFNSFNEFQIKIVLLADSPTVVPHGKDLRAIALPAG